MNTDKVILKLSLPLAALIIFASIYSLLTPGFYPAETLNWKAQSVGQDVIDLYLITPVLIITAILARKNKIAFLLWSGVNFYLIYTFVIYCFNVHFNNLFIVYCFILGLSFYSFLYFLVSQINEVIVKELYNKIVVKVIAVYLLLISCLFYFLWLSEIIPAILHNKIPKGIIETGLFTNPVQVIDLSIVLPGFFLTAIFLIKKNPIGLLLVPGMLMFCILMDITIGWLAIILNMKGIETGYSITIIMGGLMLLSIGLLIWYLKDMKHLAHVDRN
jgi:hypothetical protein